MLFLCVVLPVVHSQYQARIWRPDPPRPTSPYIPIPYVTTTPPPLTVPPTVPAWTFSTPAGCDSLETAVLVERLKRSGLYNEIYMAPDFHLAARQFPDLERLARPVASEYRCDDECEKHVQTVRAVMGPRARVQPSRAWWEDEDWETPDPNQLNSRRRSSRSVLSSVSRNSGVTEGVLGVTYSLECDQSLTDVSSDGRDQIIGYHMCNTCRAVRQLPDAYFPRVLNEVICGEKPCLRGGGRCVQRFLPFKVLKNEGDAACPKWRLVSIQLRTCCDCIVHLESPFARFLE